MSNRTRISDENSVARDNNNYAELRCYNIVKFGPTQPVHTLRLNYLNYGNFCYNDTQNFTTIASLSFDVTIIVYAAGSKMIIIVGIITEYLNPQCQKLISTQRRLQCN